MHYKTNLFPSKPKLVLKSLHFDEDENCYTISFVDCIVDVFKNMNLTTHYLQKRPQFSSYSSGVLKCCIRVNQDVSYLIYFTYMKLHRASSLYCNYFRTKVSIIKTLYIVLTG